MRLHVQRNSRQRRRTVSSYCPMRLARRIVSPMTEVRNVRCTAPVSSSCPYVCASHLSSHKVQLRTLPPHGSAQNGAHVRVASWPPCSYGLPYRAMIRTSCGCAGCAGGHSCWTASGSDEELSQSCHGYACTNVGEVKRKFPQSRDGSTLWGNAFAQGRPAIRG
jgi:hypothetical protein